MSQQHNNLFGISSILAVAAGNLTLSTEGGYSTIKITTRDTKPQNYYTKTSGTKMPSVSPSNYSIVAAGLVGDFDGAPNAGSSLSFSGVNLLLNEVAEGMVADARKNSESHAYGITKASITVEESDFVRMIVNQSNLHKHALTAIDNGTIAITANEVNLQLGGTATIGNANKKEFTSALEIIHGGSIGINANSLQIDVNTTNQIAANHGVYSIGQTESTHQKDPTFIGTSTVTLSGGSNSVFNMQVSGSNTEDYASTGLSSVVSSDPENSYINVNFDVINFAVSASEWAAGIQASTTLVPSNSAKRTDAEGNIFGAYIDITANNDLIINSSQRGIWTAGRYAKTSINITAGNVAVTGEETAIYFRASYSDEIWSQKTSGDPPVNTVSIKAENIVLNPSASGMEYGILAKVNAKESQKNLSLVDLQATEKLEINAPLAVCVYKDFFNSSDPDPDTDADTDIDMGSSASLFNLNTDEKAGTTIINGAISVKDGATVNVGLNTNTSLWTGFSQDWRSSDTPGEIYVVAKSNATWYVQPIADSTYQVTDGDTKSYVTSWESQDSSNIDLRQLNGNYQTAEEGITYQTVDIGTLTGTNTTFWVKTDIAAPRGEGTDQAIIHSGSGSHKIFVQSTGKGSEVPEQADYLIWHKEEDGATSAQIVNYQTGETEAAGGNPLAFTLANDGGVVEVVDAGIYVYRLATRPALDGTGTEWYLKRAEKTPDDPTPDPTPDPDPDPGPTPTPDPDPEYSPSTDVVRELAGFGAQYAIWWADLSDLRKRLGEVRYGAQDGAWARVITQKDSVSGVGYGGFTQKLYAVNIGIDHFAVQDEDRMWLLGGNFKYANANQRVKRSQYGKGDVHSWGMNLYATYANQYGCYSDFVLTYDHYQSKLHTRMLDNTPVGAKWNNYGYGASLEVGKMFSSTQNDEGWGPWYNHWWIEPQAQLAYYRIHGKSFTLSNGMKADPHNIDFLTGRLGVVIGKKFNYGKDRTVVDKRYSQFYLKGGIKHEFLGKQRLTVSDTVNEVTFKGNFRGTRVYYGGGFDWNFTDQLRLYAQIERENGGKYKKDYEISVGLKWQF